VRSGTSGARFELRERKPVMKFALFGRSHYALRWILLSALLAIVFPPTWCFAATKVVTDSDKGGDVQC
jgi:hypothetical protein